jgi:hypothetical protein
MSAQIPAHRDQINQPVDPADCTYLICLEHPCGGETLDIDRAELDQYNRDPDGYAAAHFRFATADEYREWIACHGAALCSARTKSGRLCRALISRIQLTPDEWKRLHRSRSCTAHAKMAEVRS